VTLKTALLIIAWIPIILLLAKLLPMTNVGL
jgi:hypothetical protein